MIGFGQILGLAALALAAAAPPSVPRGTGILVNGSFAPGEWADAAEHALDADHRLRLKQDDRYLYLAIESPRARHTGLDLYLAPAGGAPWALHVSSALGQRSLGAGGWGEIEWRSEQWGANVIGTVAGEGGMRFLAPDGFEVQIARALVPGKELALRIELKRPAAVFPDGSSERDVKGWLRWSLAPP